MCASSIEMPRGERGFTLVELLTIIIIVGILAVVVLPRMDTATYHAAEFHDRTVAALRFAQKTATSHRRPVCVSFADNHTLALTVASTSGGACTAMKLLLPGTTSNQLLSSDAGTAYYDPLPATLNFYADGSSSGASFAAGGTLITVVAETGYVL